MQNRRRSPLQKGEKGIFYLGQIYEFLLEHLAHNIVEMKGNDQGCTLCESVCRFAPDKLEMDIIVFGKSKTVCAASSRKKPEDLCCRGTAVWWEIGEGSGASVADRSVFVESCLVFLNECGCSSL